MDTYKHKSRTPMNTHTNHAHRQLMETYLVHNNEHNTHKIMDTSPQSHRHKISTKHEHINAKRAHPQIMGTLTREHINKSGYILYAHILDTHVNQWNPHHTHKS